MRWHRLAALAVAVLWSGVALGQAAPAAPVATKAKPAAKAKPAIKAPAETPEQKARLDALWPKIFDRRERLLRLDHPVVCFLDIQHPDNNRKEWLGLKDPLTGSRIAKLRAKFARLAGLECLVFQHVEITGADLDHPLIKVLMISGRSNTYSRKKDEEFYPFLRAAKIPIIGFCGGHQMIAAAHGAKTGPLGKLKPGEKDPNPKYHPGQAKEWGYTPVRIIADDPLFAGLPREPLLREMHAFQVVETPQGFSLLASTDLCRVQAIKCNDRMVYGVQFHPEAHDDEHPHGTMLLENFFRMALAKR